MAEESKVPGPDAVIDDELFDPAVKWFAGRLAMTRKQVDQMTLDARRKVFFVTGLSDMEAIKGVQDSLARALEKGDTFEEWKAQVKEKNLFRGPEFTGHRLQTIFRTNLQNAFQTGRYMEMTTPAVMKRRPYWRFSAVRDGRTTPVCASAHGTVLKADHPWWKTHIPPLHFNCRSTMVSMKASDAEKLITAHPTELNAALGFGNPPFGVPASAKDLPTAEEQAEIRKASEAVQTAVEERNAASEALQKARHEETKARNWLKKAEKALANATDEELPERKDEVREAATVASFAREHTKAAEQALQKSQAEAEKLARKGQICSWRLVKARIDRLDVGVASDAAKLLKEMLPYVEYLDEVENFDGEKVGIVTPDGHVVYVRQGDTFRKKALRLIQEEAKKKKEEEEERKKKEKTPRKRRKKLKMDKKVLAKILDGEDGSFEATADLFPDFHSYDLLGSKSDRNEYDRITGQVKTAFQKAENGDESLISRDEAHNIWQYTGNDFTKFNGALRNKFYGNSAGRSLEFEEKSASGRRGLERFTIERDMLLSRGVDDFRFLSSHVDKEDIEGLQSLLLSGDTKGVAERINNAIHEGAYSGKFVEPAFMSTSGAKTGSFQKRITLRILAHKDTPGIAPIAKVSQFSSENDFLVAPPPSLEIVKAYATKDAYGHEKLVIIAELDDNRVGKKEMKRPVQKKERIQ